MLVIRVEMWPKGSEEKKYDLAAICIANTGSNQETADYEFAISHQINTDRGKYWRGIQEFVNEFHQGYGPNIWKKGLVENFFRRDGAVKLLSTILKKARL